MKKKIPLAKLCKTSLWPWFYTYSGAYIIAGWIRICTLPALLLSTLCCRNKPFKITLKYEEHFQQIHKNTCNYALLGICHFGVSLLRRFWISFFILREEVLHVIWTSDYAACHKNTVSVLGGRGELRGAAEAMTDSRSPLKSCGWSGEEQPGFSWLPASGHREMLGRLAWLCHLNFCSDPPSKAGLQLQMSNYTL